MNMSTVTVKGQVVIPAGLRKKLGMKPGTKVHFSEKDGEVRLVPITRQLIAKNFGLLKGKRSLLKALAEEKKREREL